MTIEAAINRVGIIGNGVTVAIPFPYPVFDPDLDLVVIETVIATGAQTTRPVETYWTWSGTPDDAGHYPNGGTVTALVAPPSTVTWTIYRDPPATQGLDLVANDDLPAEATEAQFDYVTLLIQRLQERVSRTMEQVDGDSAAIGRLPPVLARASKYLAFDSSGNPEAVDAATASGTSVLATGAVQTRLQADLWADVVNVRNYDLTGGADYTAAFIAAAAEGRDLFVPFGNYTTGSFTLDGVRMFGPGTLIWKTSADATWITLTNGASIDGPYFDGNASNQSHADARGIFVNASPASAINGCDFSNFRKFIILTEFTGTITSLGGRVTNNRFHDSGTIANANAVSICASNWVVANNLFTGGWGSEGHMVRIGQFSLTTPVLNTVIANNFFTNDLYSGIVLELYAQHTTITGNTFDTLEQAIKMESAGATVLYTTITGNSFKDVGAAGVALNLTGDYVNFSSNTLLNVAGPVDVGNNSRVSDNIMVNVGDATHASIEQDSGFTVSSITDNIIISAPFDGIVVSGGEATVKGNRLKAITRRGVSVFGANHTVEGNNVDGVVDGIVINSAVTNSTFANNTVLNASGTEYSFAKNDSFKTNYFDSASNIGFAGDTFSYTIASGAIEVGRSDKFVALDTEAAGATDDLTTITATNCYAGQIVVLRSTSAARVPTVKDGTNLKLEGDMVLNSTEDSLTLMWHGTYWEELARANNS